MEVTNLKISPYFDDFDRSKNYQKVLFKPGFSVQTRELNTLQSILQNQIDRFGSHVFKDGSVVIPGNLDYSVSYKAVLIQPLINGISVETLRTNTFKAGTELTGLTSGVKAEVVNSISAETSEKDTITLYVKYTSGGNITNNIQALEFQNNEVLQNSDGTSVAVTAVQNASAYTGSSATINAGVYFIRGYFVEVSTQTIILDQYNNKPSYKIGLQVKESISTTSDDDSLYDNALGTTNYASPGADRLKITATLTKQNLLLTDDANFIELLRLESGEPTVQVNNSLYSELEKNLARRTYDESGHYSINPFSVKIKEALDDGVNGGIFLPNSKLEDGRTIVDGKPSSSDPTNSINGNDYYAVELSEGKAYVKGFEVVSNRKQYKIVEKPRKTITKDNKGFYLNVGSYFKLDDSVGTRIKGIIGFGAALSLKNVANVEVGTAKAFGLVDKTKLYVADVNLYTDLNLSQTAATSGLTEGDFVTGQTSGATAYVKSVTGANAVIYQTSGTFSVGETLLQSRYTTAALPTINGVGTRKLEDIRTITSGTGTNSFLGTILQDTVNLTGASFTLSSGTTFTGVGSNFANELSSVSKIRIGAHDKEIASVSSSTAAVFDTAGSVADGIYYDVKKYATKLYASDSGLTSRVYTNPIAATEDFSHYKTVSISLTADGSGETTVNGGAGEEIDKNSVFVTTNTGIDSSITVTNPDANSPNIIKISGLGNNSTANIYYTSRVPVSTTKTKTKEKYQIFDVYREKNISNNAYGTRFVDKDISLGKQDVFKIHAIHEAADPTQSVTSSFDRLKLNSSLNIEVGDLIVSGLIRARVISKASSDIVYVKYLSTTKFQSGTNLAISVDVPTNSVAAGIFIRESYYGRYRDVTDEFILVKNDTDSFYRPSKLVRKSFAPIPQRKLVVVYDYFDHANLNNDFYNKSSYDITYGDTPLSYNYNSYADIVDFRYVIDNGTSGSGTIDAPYSDNNTNPLLIDGKTIATSLSFVHPTSLINLDYSFYLGRVDNVYLTPDGEIEVVRGADSITPQETEDDSLGLHIATLNLPPYLKDVRDATIKIEKSRNYTMKDIGRLETRLSNVEKYSSLNLLENNTVNLNILDGEGRNRFKNGFVVDSFTNTDVADLSNPNYTASIDLDNNLARPYPYVTGVGFTYNTASTTKLTSGETGNTSGYITIPYTETSYITSGYASRVENLQPFEVFTWLGEMEISPKKDIWYDTVREIKEGQSINLVDSYKFLWDEIGAGAEEWGSWTTTSSSRSGGGTTVNQVRSGQQDVLNSLNFDIESGDTIDKVTDVRFSRSRVVNVKTESLKPNTKFYFHIDDVNSNNIAYPKLLKELTNNNGVSFVIGETVELTPIYDDNIVRPQLIQGIRATVQNPNAFTNLTPTSDFTNAYTGSTNTLAIDNVRSLDDSDINPGEIGVKFRIRGLSSGATAESLTQQTLKSNETGILEAFVLLPPRTFETGDLTFSLADDINNVKILGLSGSYASSNYYTQGTTLNVSATITSIEVPEVTTVAINDSRSFFVPDPPPRRRGRDPLAQSFFINDKGGVFVSSIDLFFYSKDTTAPVTMEIRTVENGIPTDIVVPSGKVTIPASSIQISDDASKSTRFTFKKPVYLSDKTDYVFVVKSISKSYNVWVSRLGEKDVSTGFVIDKQPAIGVLFKSANNKTWISDQYEDIKFTLNRCKFTPNTSYTAILNNKPVPLSSLPNNPLTVTNGSSVVTVKHPNHGMHKVGDKVTFSNIVSDTLNAQLSTSLTVNATEILMIDSSGNARDFSLATAGDWYSLDNANVSESNLGYAKIGDEIISYSGVTSTGLTGCTRGVLNTIASTHSKGDVVECHNLVGIPLQEFNTTHIITNVINMDEYQITTTTKAGRSKQSGGNNVLGSRNIAYQSIEPKFRSFVPIETTANLTIDSLTGKSLGNATQIPYTIKTNEVIENNVENILNEPKLIASATSIDANSSLASLSGTLNTNIELSTTNDRLSPIIDLEGSSIVTISNRIVKETLANGTLDLSSELLPKGGKHSAYITKKVVLENTSTSVKVLFDGIRNSSNEFKVFVKTRDDGDPGDFDEMGYTEIPSVNYPSSETKSQYRAFDFEIKDLSEFKEFSVKIAMIGNDQSDIPKIRNVRCLALAI